MSPGATRPASPRWSTARTSCSTSSGKSVNCRYNEKNKAEIFRSRLETTAALGRAIQAVPTPPSVWMNASTATIYRDARDRPMTEAEGELGEGFSVDVATSWERALFDHPRDGVRQVALRTAITLGDGSALTPLVGLTRLGLGGPQRGRYHGAGAGNGDQHFSWVHLDDVLPRHPVPRGHPARRRRERHLAAIR